MMYTLHALLTSGLLQYAGCACGKATCLQQALCLHHKLQTDLSEWVTAYFRSTGADELGRHLQRDMAAEHRRVEARLWEMLLQMFRVGKKFCTSVTKQDNELSKQLQVVTKEWLIWAVDQSDPYARQAVEQQLFQQYTAQAFVSKYKELHDQKCRSQASLSAPASAPAPTTNTPQPARLEAAQPGLASSTSYGTTSRACETNLPPHSSPPIQPSTPPKTWSIWAKYFSADGTEGIGPDEGRMHLTKNNTWRYSRDRPHRARDGPHGEPAYKAAGGLTGRDACGKAMHKNYLGTWRYDI